jgi:hypothetical protein
VKPPEVRRLASPQEDQPADDHQTATTLPDSDSVTKACDAFVVLAITPTGKTRRRVYFSLHSASQAVQRARRKGEPAYLELCRLTPVTADHANWRWVE